MNEEKIIQAIRRRDEQAMARVMDRYAKLLWSVAGAVLSQRGCVQDAEECVADAFIYLWEHPEQFDPKKGKLKSWLVIIARTRAIDRYRSLSRENVLSLEDGSLAESLRAQEPTLGKETRRTLVEAVYRMEEPAREILLRRYAYGQKPREIALAMDLSVKQVDNHLYYAKGKLRQELAAEFGGQDGAF